MINEFDTYFGNSSDAVLLVDAENQKVIAVNAYACEFLKSLKKDIIGKKWWSKKVIDVSAEEVIRIKEILYLRRNWKGIWTLKNSEEEQYTDIHITLIKEGNKEYFLARIIDTSETLKAFQQRVNTNEKLSNILENIDNVVYNISIDKDGNKAIRYLSPYVEKLFGYSVEDFITLSKTNKILECYHPEDVDAVQDASKKIKKTKSVLKHTYRFLPGDRTNYIYIEETIIPQFDKNNRHIGNLGIARDVTDEVVYKSYLEASENRYRTLLENNVAGVFRTTVEGNMVLCNAAFAKLFGYASYDEMVKVKAQSFYVDVQDRKNYINELLKKRTLHNYEVKQKKRDGSPIYTLNNVSIFKDENGKDRFIEGTLIDITELKKIQQELTSAKERFENLVKSVPIGILIHVEGVCKFINQNLINLIGSKDITGKNIINLFNKKERTALEKTLEKSRQNKKKIKTEILHITSAGNKKIYVEYQCVDIKYEGKEAHLVTFRDVSQTQELQREISRAELAEETNKTLAKEIQEHERTQQELVKAQEFTKNMINSSLDMIIATDITNKITQISPSSLQAFGYKEEEIIGKKSLVLYANKEDYDRVVEAIREKGVFVGEITNKKKSGEKFTSYLSATTIRDNKNKIVGYMGISRDITDMKKAEEELVNSEKKYRNLFENMYDAVLIVDDNSDILDINDSGKKLFEIENIKGKQNLYDFIHPEFYDYCRKYAQILKKEKFIQRITIKIITAKKSIRYVEFSSAAIYEKRKYKGARHVLRDITRIMESEELIKHQSSKIQSFFENTSSMMMYTLDRNFQLTSFNTALKEVMRTRIGVEIKQGDRLLDYIKPFVSTQKFTQMQKIYTSAINGEALEIEGSIRDVNGDRMWLESFLTPIKIKGQKIFEIACLAHEITTKKEAEIKLKYSEEYNKAIIKALPDLIFRMSSDGYYLDVFFKSKTQLAIDTQAYIGKKVTETDTVHGKTILRNIRQVARTGKIITQNYEVFNEGKESSYEARYVKINGKEVLAIIRDVTEQKNAENQLRESLKEKEVLLKEVHHRVKNNLQVISSILNLQSSFVRDKGTISILKEGQNRIKSMSFIHEILYQTKNFSEVNFANYLNNLTTNLYQTYAVDGENVRLKKEINNINVSLDQAIPCGLITNELISNALKYAFPDNRKGTIFIGLKSRNKKTEIRIEDDGVGLPKNFDVEKSESLGLQLVYTLIEQLDGTIKVSSKKGTKYLITFASTHGLTENKI